MTSRNLLIILYSLLFIVNIECIRNINGTGIAPGNLGAAGGTFIQPEGPETGNRTYPLARGLSNFFLADDPRPGIRLFESTLIPVRDLKKNQHPDDKKNALSVAFGQFITHDLTRNRTPLNVSNTDPNLTLFDNDPLCQLIALVTNTTLYFFDCRSTVTTSNGSTTITTNVFEYLIVNDRTWEYHPPPVTLTVPSNNFIKRARIFPLITRLSNTSLPFNDVTSFLDLSPIYGSSDAINNILRTHDGTGHLETAPDGNLPFIQPGLANDCTTFDPTENIPSSGSGDSRVDENLYITAIHSLYFRNHNRIANWLKTKHPTWTDDQLFLRARDINIGAYQRQVYEEYIEETFRKKYVRQFLGNYHGYESNVDPRITSSFDIAFRVAHSEVSLPPYIIDEDCNKIRINGTLGFPGQSRPNCIFTTFRTIGAKAIFQSSMVQHAQIISGKISDLMRGAVFSSGNNQNTPPFNIDIETLNILRGREFRIKNINDLREYWLGESFYDEPCCERTEPQDPIECFDLLTQNRSKAEDLRSVYKHIDQVEAFIGLMFEDDSGNHKDDFGELTSKIILDQFKRTRSADPNWWEIFPYEHNELKFVRETVAEILEENFGIDNIKDSALQVQKEHRFC